MKRLSAAVLACLMLSACGLRPVDLARMPQGTYGPGVNVDDGAIVAAQVAFNGEAPVPSDPARLALALASVDYLAGEYSAGGRWAAINPLIQATMMMARDEIRRALEVAPTASSQLVVDSLLAFSHATTPQARLAAVSSPIYTLGAAGTVARLQAMPPLPRTANAVIYASHHLFDGEDLAYNRP